jgi:hypothetical protein
MLSAMIWDLRGNYNPFWMKLQCKEPPSEGQTAVGERYTGRENSYTTTTDPDRGWL